VRGGGLTAKEKLINANHPTGNKKMDKKKKTVINVTIKNHLTDSTLNNECKGDVLAEKM
jgi:hypothetical protein